MLQSTLHFAWSLSVWYEEVAPRTSGSSMTVCTLKSRPSNNIQFKGEKRVMGKTSALNKCPSDPKEVFGVHLKVRYKAHWRLLGQGKPSGSSLINLSISSPPSSVCGLVPLISGEHLDSWPHLRFSLIAMSSQVSLLEWYCSWRSWDSAVCFCKFQGLRSQIPTSGSLL